MRVWLTGGWRICNGAVGVYLLRMGEVATDLRGRR